MKTSYKIDKVIKQLTLSAMFIVLFVILNRFATLTIPAFGVNAFLRVGFSSIVIVMASLILGPIYGTVIGGIGDFIGAMIFPIGAYFIGYTISYALIGLFPGLIMFFIKKYNLKNKVFTIINISLETCLFLFVFIYILINKKIPLESTKFIELNSNTLIIILILISIFYFIVLGLNLFFTLKEKKESPYAIPKLIFIYTIIEIVCFFILNSIWGVIIMDIPFIIQILARILKSFFTIPLLVCISKPLIEILKKIKVIENIE